MNRSSFHTAFGSGFTYGQLIPANARGIRRWDPRVKLGLLVLVIVLNVGLARLWLSSILLVIGLSLGLFSRISPRSAALYFLAPVWATLLVMLGFCVGFGETPVVSWGAVTIYKEGILQGFAAGSRVACDVSWLAVVFLTTPFTEIMGALKWFRIPEILLDVISLSYRYAALLYGEFFRMKEAARSRGGFQSYADRCKSTARIINQVFLRAFDRAQRIQQSMRMRGEGAFFSQILPGASSVTGCPNRCDITPDYAGIDSLVLKCRDVSHRYGQDRSLHRISLDLYKGEAVALCGPNGAGKTTLLRLIAGLLTAERGEICVCGMQVTEKNRNHLFRRVGLLAQDANDQLFCTHVVEDIAYGPVNMGLDKTEVIRRVETAMHLMEVSHLAARPIHSLSYGEMKRVGLAGLIAMQTPLILLDEPTASLDPASANHLVDLIKHLNSHHEYTVMMVTHDINLASRIAQRVIILNNGRVTADAPARRILSDQHLLEESRLEPPILTRLFQRLMSRDSTEEIPLTIEEAIEYLRQNLMPDSATDRCMVKFPDLYGPNPEEMDGDHKKVSAG